MTGTCGWFAFIAFAGFIAFVVVILTTRSEK